MGPEQNINNLSDQMNDIEWDGTGVGYGVRGSHLEDLTIRFTGTSRLNEGHAHHLLAEKVSSLMLPL